MLFHTSTKKLQQSQGRGGGKDKDLSPPKPYTEKPPSPTDPKTQSDKRQAPTDSEMEEYIPGFSKLDTNGQLAKIELAKSHFAAQIEKDDPACKQQRKAEATIEILSAKEKEVRKADWSWDCSGASCSVFSFDLQRTDELRVSTDGTME